MQKVLYSSENLKVYDRYKSHNHISRRDLHLLQIAIKNNIDNILANEFIILSHSFEENIGKTSCVRVSDNDRFFYAKRKNRSGYSKFVLDREPEDCNNVIAILKQTTVENEYILITSFVGNPAEPEPWDKIATQKAFDFWESHALIVSDLSEIDESSITYDESVYYPTALPMVS